MTLKVKIYIIFSPEDFIHGCGELGYIAVWRGQSPPAAIVLLRSCVCSFR